MNKITLHSKVGLLILFMFSGLLLHAQTTLSGVVKGDDGEPLIGANVLVQGTTEGTVTDIDGNFSLTTSASLPLTLEVSYTGYSTPTTS